MAITGAVAAAVRKFDPFPEFSEVRACRGRRETGGRQFYKSGGLIVPRYEMLPGVLVQGGAGFGQREVNGAWRGARDGEPLIGDGGLRGAEARPNSIRNPVMAGAVAGTPGTFPTNWGFAGAPSGLSLSVVSAGKVGGLDYVDFRIAGTPSASSVYGVQTETPIQVVASSGQTWTGAGFLALVGGSTANVVRVLHRVRSFTSDGTTGVEASAGVDIKGALTGNLQAFAESVTLANASSARVLTQLLVEFTSGQPIDITIRIAAPNLKLGPDINDPPILQTSGLAATRTAMAYRETGRNIAPVHYGVARARWLAPIANHVANFPHLMEFRASGPERVLWYASVAGNGVRFTAGSTGGVGDPVLALGTPTVGQWASVAWALRGSELAVSQNGAAIISGAMSAPPTLTQVSFLNGVSGLNNVANAEFDFFATANGEITNDNLQALAARFAA